MTAASPAAAAPIPPGFDLFETNPAATVFAFNDEFTIPAGFFGTGSQPFSGVVRFGGVPLRRFEGMKTGDADTIVHRPDAAAVSPGTSATVPVQLMALNLVSIQPIKVTFDNGTANFFDVFVRLSNSQPSQGTATISEASGNGGTMNSQLVVFPVFDFVPLGGGPKRTIDVGKLPLSPASLAKITLHGTNTPWHPGCAPPALPIPGLNDGFCPSFTPDEKKQLSVEDTQAARHGIEPVQPMLEHFKCYGIKPQTRFKQLAVQLRDEFGAGSARVLRPLDLCAPVGKNGEPVDNEKAHLKCYAIKTPPSRPQVVFTRNQFGSEVLQVGAAQELCTPALKELAKSKKKLKLNSAQLPDHFECYSVSGRFRPLDVQLRDQFGAEHVRVLRAVRICNPAQKNGVPIQHPIQHLECYEIKDLGGRFKSRLVRVRDQFGIEVLAVVRPRTLCVPSLKIPADLPVPRYPFVPPTVPPTLTRLRLTPASQTIVAGGSQTYTATGLDASGNSLGDVTAATTFSISPDGSCTKNTCTATNAGTHTVTANDGGNTGTATLMVNPGPLDHITISPPNATIAANANQAYSATGFDQYGNQTGDVTSATTLAISPNGGSTGASCSNTAHTCTASQAQTYMVTGTDGGAPHPNSPPAMLTVSPSCSGTANDISGTAKGVVFTCNFAIDGTVATAPGNNMAMNCSGGTSPPVASGSSCTYAFSPAVQPGHMVNVQGNWTNPFPGNTLMMQSSNSMTAVTVNWTPS